MSLNRFATFGLPKSMTLLGSFNGLTPLSSYSLWRWADIPGSVGNIPLRRPTPLFSKDLSLHAPMTFVFPDARSILGAHIMSPINLSRSFIHSLSLLGPHVWFACFPDHFFLLYIVIPTSNISMPQWSVWDPLSSLASLSYSFPKWLSKSSGFKC
jgi:hypothetical protein